MRLATFVHWLLALTACFAVHGTASAQADDDVVVTFLGTGTPSLNVERYGAATLVEAGGKLLLFDAGRGAAIRLRQAGFVPVDLDAIFLTHFHSDHVVGLPDLFLTRVIIDAGREGRDTPFRLIGPPGTRALANGVRTAYSADLAIRRNDEGLSGARMEFDVAEAEAGIVYDQDGVRVTMFSVDHGDLIKPAVGYRIDTQSHSVVLSGDTRYDPRLADIARGVDLFVHEVAIADDAIMSTPRFARIMSHHTLPEEAGRIFAAAAPRLGVISHIGMHGDVDEEDIAAGVRKSYDGPLLIADDLDRVTLEDGEPKIDHVGARR